MHNHHSSNSVDTTLRPWHYVPINNEEYIMDFIRSTRYAVTGRDTLSDALSLIDAEAHAGEFTDASEDVLGALVKLYNDEELQS